MWAMHVQRASEEIRRRHFSVSRCELSDFQRRSRRNAAHGLDSPQTGGIFVFDFWYGPGVLTDPPTERVKRLEDGAIQVTRTAKPTLWPNENVVDVHYRMQVKQNSNGMVADIEETHRMRYLFLPELRWMLQEAGLDVLDAQSWMSGELGTGSWFGVIVARKRQQ